MGRHIVHFEIPADDPVRAGDFYRAAFDWDVRPVPGMDYTAIGTTPTDEQGAALEPGTINGGMRRRDQTLTGPCVTIDVEDIDRALETIGRLGGSTVQAKAPVGAIGFTAYFRDTEGNLMGLWQGVG